jgi:hypothetical protein
MHFALFSEAYQEFVRCLELCTVPGSKLPLAWAEHFNRCSTDPRMKSAFKMFLYMDIKMRQQLFDKPFSPDTRSTEYSDAWLLADREVNEERIADMNKMSGHSRRTSNRTSYRYQPYATAGPSDPAGSRNSGGYGQPPFRSKAEHHARPKPCLKCGLSNSHISIQCTSTSLHGHPDHKTSVSAKDKKTTTQTPRPYASSSTSPEHALLPPRDTPLTISPLFLDGYPRAGPIP